MKPNTMRPRRLGEELESYLVFLLIGHMRDTHLHRNAIAIDYLLAKTQAGKRHREELRTVGDRCLLLAGLYPEQAQQRMVGLDYFIAMGSQAYNELAHALRATVADLIRTSRARLCARGARAAGSAAAYEGGCAAGAVRRQRAGGCLRRSAFSWRAVAGRWSDASIKTGFKARDSRESGNPWAP